MQCLYICRCISTKRLSVEELQDPLSSSYPCLFGPGALVGEEKRNKLTGDDGDDNDDGDCNGNVEIDLDLNIKLLRAGVEHPGEVDPQVSNA